MLIHVPLESVADNPYQRRQDYGDVAALAADIQRRGLLQIPRGRLLFDGQPQTQMQTTRSLEMNGPGWPAGAAFRVELAFGHRRLRAYRALADAHGGHWTAMPVYVESLTDDAMLDAVWSENQHRSDINPIEQAELLAEKLDRVRAAGGSQQTLAAEWGLDRSTIANKLRLLELPADAQTALRDRKLSERQALALLPVVELQDKLNGSPVAWRDGRYEEYGVPIAPAAFLAHVVAKPDAATSDAIRDYARRALAQAGVPLPDVIATLDTGDTSDPIVQPLCAGCPYRYNQHCLNRPCYTAKRLIFRQRIPTLAAAHTGLPWSDDSPNTIATTDRDQGRGLYSAYTTLGLRDSLVITWVPEGYFAGWFDGGSAGYRSPSDIASDWRKGLLLGRDARQYDAPEAERPPRDTWRRLRSDYNQQRKGRVKDAFVEAIAPLAEQPDALRALVYLLFSRSTVPQGTPAQLAQRLAEHAFGFVYTSDRDELRHALETAGIPAMLSEPADPTDRLREMAAEALEDWYNYRDTSGVPRAKAAAAVRRVASHFAGHNIIGISPDDESQPDDLRELAHWLALALADIDAQTAHPQEDPATED